MCKLINKLYSETAPFLNHKNPALWTSFEIDVMKSACSTGHQECLTVVRNFAQKLLQNESSNLYVLSDVAANIYHIYIFMKYNYPFL